MKPPPQQLFDDAVPQNEPANYLRFRISPNSAVALAARVKRAGEEFIGDQRELYLLDVQPDELAPTSASWATPWRPRSVVHPRAGDRGGLGGG